MIRSAAIKDLPAILEILNEAILNSTAVYEYEPWPIERLEKWFRTRLEAGFPVLVFEEEHIVRGYATFGAFRARIAYRFTVEHSIYVHHQCRGKGIGHLLLNELITLAESEKAHSMVGVIDATNIKSIAFHKQHGFEQTGVLREVGFKFDRWLDIALLQRLL
ncbi:MAG: N-acetyltransferase family protein [Flavobacteriales bacterium]